MQFDRRQFIQALGGTVAFTSLAGCSLASQNVSKLTFKPGIQLYMVRHKLQEDFAGTIKKIAELGYEEIEFYDYFGHSREAIKTLLHDNGLTSPSTHIGINEINSDLDQFFDVMAEYGHSYVTMAYIEARFRNKLDDYKVFCDRFNKAGEIAKSKGIQFGYHNHDFEFVLMEGQMPYDLILANTDPNLVKMTLDVGWMVRAGQNPARYIKENPKRFEQWHLKDVKGVDTVVPLGQGEIDFPALFKLSDLAGLKHAYVEVEDQPDSFLAADISARWLRSQSS